jgi:hypothetical protein
MPSSTGAHAFSAGRINTMPSFDITQPPLTSAEIETRRQQCQRAIDALYKRQRLWTISLIVAATIYVAIPLWMNAVFALVPWKEMAPFSFTSLAAVLILTAISCGFYNRSRMHCALVGVAVSLGFIQFLMLHETYHHALILCCFVFVVLGGFIGWALESSTSLFEPITSAELDLRSHDTTPLSDCGVIKTWLDVPIVRAYRDAVILQRRAFIRGEVNAMRDVYLTGVKADRDSSENAKLLSDAQAVYGDTLPLINQA